MPERIKQIPTKIKEMWNKLTKRQKVITVSSVGIVIVTLVILILLLSKVQYEVLSTFETTAQAKNAIELLDEAQITNRLQDDNLTIEVDASRKQDAVLALAGSESTTGVSLTELLTNDLSTTNSDRNLKTHLFMQGNIASQIESFIGVDKASVVYFPADVNQGILQQQKDISCSVFVTTNEQFDYKTEPQSIAVAVAYAMGNSGTDLIKVIDQNGDLIFGGEEEEEDIQDLEANLAYKKTVEKWYKDKLFELAIKNGFTDAEFVCSLDVNCDKESILFTEYLAGEGLEQGLYDSYQKISSSSKGGSGDIPGTDSNDETDYYIQESSAGNSEYEELNVKYRPSEKVTQTYKEWGVINNATSSLAGTFTKHVTYKEEDLELMGLLEGTTFEEYSANNSQVRELEVPDSFYELFSDASGIPVSNITLTAYEIPNFIAREIKESNIPLYLEILLAALIIGLLLFVVFRAMKPEEIVETEPELSVERLLATTKENQSLEDIEFGEKSETRKMIEKYIDENPEAVAALLRNWLTDDGWE